MPTLNTVDAAAPGAGGPGGGGLAGQEGLPCCTASIALPPILVEALLETW